MAAMPRLAWLCLLAACAAEAPPSYTARVEGRVAVVAARVEGLLGKRFDGPVAVRVVDPPFIAKYAHRLAAQMIPRRQVRIAQQLAVRLRQVPAGYDIIANQVKMVADQAKGLYDPRERCFYVVEGHADPGSVLFDYTVAHELIHAYRHVDHAYWDWIVSTVDADADWAIALSCLVEGEATLLGRILGSRNEEPQKLLERTAKHADMLADQLASKVDAPGISDYPLSLRETFLGRYAAGVLFAGAVYNRGGLPALAQAYGRPPRSTEQVLHPRKYFGPDTDEPTLFEGGDPTTALGPGWKLLMSNVMGEFDVRVHFAPLLGRGRAEQIANGWDGARYFFCARESAEFVGLVSTWDREVDAEAFAEAWLEWAAARDGQRGEVGDGRVDTREGLVVVRQAGKDVFVADGVPLERIRQVLQALASARRSERAQDAHPAR